MYVGTLKSSTNNSAPFITGAFTVGAGKGLQLYRFKRPHFFSMPLRGPILVNVEKSYMNSHNIQIIGVDERYIINLSDRESPSEFRGALYNLFGMAEGANGADDLLHFKEIAKKREIEKEHKKAVEKQRRKMLSPAGRHWEDNWGWYVFGGVVLLFLFLIS